jgi:hypothetical protein
VGGGTLATPASYTKAYSNSTFNQDNWITEASPSTTPAISYALGSSNFWIDFQVELLSAPPPKPRSFAALIG